MHKADFYTGVVADFYDILVPENEHGTHGFYHDAIVRDGEPALELCCGTGRPLLEFLEAGLDVEGLDASADMLAECRRKAEARGLRPVLHEQRMESFALERRYRSIFVTVSSFTLLLDLEEAKGALACCFAHLEPSGRVWISLELPRAGRPPEPADRWFVLREGTREDGSVLRCSGRSVPQQPGSQVQLTRLRYEILRNGELEHREEREFATRWHTQQQFRELLEAAGFVRARALRFDGSEARPDDRVFVCTAERP